MRLILSSRELLLLRASASAKTRLILLLLMALRLILLLVSHEMDQRYTKTAVWIVLLSEIMLEYDG